MRTSSPLMLAVQEKRLAESLTTTELSYRLGLSKSTIAALERGRHSPNSNTYRALLRWLGAQPMDYPRAFQNASPYKRMAEQLEELCERVQILERKMRGEV